MAFVHPIFPRALWSLKGEFLLAGNSRIIGAKALSRPSGVPMSSGSRLLWVVLAVACVLGVLAMTMFPAPWCHAPFNAVNGPTTDLRSSINVAQALPLILAALIVARMAVPLAPAHSELLHREFATEHSSAPPPHTIVLRC